MIIPRLNCEKFQDFHLDPELSFLKKNHQNDNKGEFLDFNEFHQAIIEMAIFKEKSRQSYTGRIRRSGNLP